jgi:hypothetical protein
MRLTEYHPARNGAPWVMQLPWFIGGITAALILIGGAAELYLGAFPPQDFQAYLGESSPLTANYIADHSFGVTYRDWDSFYSENADRMRSFLPVDGNSSGRPLWAFFGNSFVQAPGMLADLARDQIPERRIFNLGRNELLFVRLAQIRLLLERGLKPERIFVELMPVDMLSLGEQPLATILVTSKGALTYLPRLPDGPARWLVEHSQLARAAWFRAGRHRGNTRFNKRTVQDRIEEPLRGDLDHLFTNLAAATRARQVPVTVVLIPSYEQVVHRAGCGFQDVIAATLRPQGYDIFDPRDAFERHPNPAGLFLPDKHFNRAGNELLLEELLAHLRLQSAGATAP